VLSCIEQPAVQRSLDAAVEKWGRAHDAWESLTWTVAHDPEAGTPLNETGSIRAYEFVGARSIDMPTVTVIYEITALGVLFHDARFVHAEAPYAGRA